MTKSLDSTGLKRLHRDWRRRTDQTLALALDAVSGPFNVGSIVRSAAAWRVDHVWLLGDAPELDGGKVAKTALGTERYLSWSRVETPEQLRAESVEAGYQLVGIELAEGAVPLHEVEFADSVCLVVGHEDRGIRPAVLEQCDVVAYLPQLGKVGSLNVATAAAVAMYEVRRRVWRR